MVRDRQPSKEPRRDQRSHTGGELTNGTTSTTTRYITSGGATVATKTAAGIRITAADTQATTQLNLDPTTGAVSRRWATPYGAERATIGSALLG